MLDRARRRARAARPLRARARRSRSRPSAPSSRARLARRGATRGRRGRAPPGRRRLQAPPRPASDVDGDQSRGERQEERRCRRGRRRRRPRPARSPTSSTTRSKNAGSGLRTPRLADDEMTSAGSAASRAQRLERLRLIPDDADPQAELAGRARGSRSRPGRGRRASTGCSCHQPVGLLEPEMAPERVVLLTPLDRDTERRPDDVRLQTGALGEPAPPPLLVDERLADVEDDCLQSHDSTSARSAEVVTLSSRGSPSTTATRPPLRSTSDAQSVAPARSPANARRSAGARKACGVCAADEPRRGRPSPRRRRRGRASGCPTRAGRARRRRSPRRAARAPARRRRRRRAAGPRRGRARRAPPREPRRAQPRTDSARVAPPGHAGDHLRRRELLGEQDRGLLPARGRSDDDRVDPARSGRAGRGSRRAGGARRAPRTPSGDRYRAARRTPAATISAQVAPAYAGAAQAAMRSPLRPSASLATSASAARHATGRRRARRLPLPRPCPSRT